VNFNVPHFGLMDETTMGKKEAALQRARLHIRGARRRLRQGKFAAGVATLYDALSFAMRWYVLSRGPSLKHDPTLNLEDTKAVFSLLVDAGVLRPSFEFDPFDRLLEEALSNELSDLDWQAWLERIEALMSQLGVMPFDEGSLPPEDPATY
jgi:hypothetical protein